MYPTAKKIANDQQQLLRYHPNEVDGVKVQGQGVLGVERFGGESEAVQLEGVRATQVQLHKRNCFAIFCRPSRLSNAALQVHAKA